MSNFNIIFKESISDIIHDYVIYNSHESFVFCREIEKIKTGHLIYESISDNSITDTYFTRANGRKVNIGDRIEACEELTLNYNQQNFDHDRRLDFNFKYFLDSNNSVNLNLRTIVTQ